MSKLQWQGWGHRLVVSWIPSLATPISKKQNNNNKKNSAVYHLLDNRI